LRTLALLCLFGVCLGCAQVAHTKAPPASTAPVTSKSQSELIDSVRPSVIQVAVKISGTSRPPNDPCFAGSRVCIAGTGFFVDASGYAVTALHVVEGFTVPGPDGNPQPHPGTKEVIAALAQIGTLASLEIGVALPNVETGHLTIAAGTMFFPAEVVATDPAHDLALIKATVNPFTNMPRTFAGTGSAGLPQAKAQAVTISTTRPTDGEEIFACGYPLGSPGLVTTSGTIASAWNSRVLVRAAAAGFSIPVEVYDVDLRMNPGNSGGPVFRSSDQAVIGLDVQTFGNLATIVPSKFVARFLDANKISWQKPQ
jgi:S1-C subfamily serine protease